MNDFYVRMWALVSFVIVTMQAFDRRTDIQTDRRMEMPSQYRALHYIKTLKVMSYSTRVGPVSFFVNQRVALATRQPLLSLRAERVRRGSWCS